MCSLLRGRYLQYVATLTVSVQVVITTMALSWPATALGPLLSPQSPIGVTIATSEVSIITSVLVFGSIFAALVVQIIFNKLGVKKSLLISCVPTAAGWVLVGTANSVAMLIVGRFILGFSTAFGIAGCSLYIAEIAEPEIRGRLAILNAVMIELGGIITVVVGGFSSYKVLALVSFMGPVLFVLLFFFMPETPCYHLKRGDAKQALAVLKKFRATDDVREEFARMESNVKQSAQKSGFFKDLYTNKQYRKDILIVLGTKTIHQLSGFGIIQQYLGILFGQTSSTISPTISTIISFCVPLPAMFVASLLIDWLGRRPLYFASLGGCMLGLLCECVYFALQRNGADVSMLGWLPLTGVLLFLVMKSLGLTQFPYLLLSELFPPNVKNHATSVILFYNACLLFVVSLLFPQFSALVGIEVTFLLFAICLAIGMVFVAVFVPETKGKSLEQIQEDKGN